MGHLQLFLKIGENAQPPQQNLCSLHSGIGHGQSIKCVNFDIWQVLSGLLNLCHSLVNRKQRRFSGISHNDDNQPTKQPTASLDDIEMPQSDGIETTRINRYHRIV